MEVTKPFTSQFEVLPQVVKPLKGKGVPLQSRLSTGRTLRELSDTPPEAVGIGGTDKLLERRLQNVAEGR